MGSILLRNSKPPPQNNQLFNLRQNDFIKLDVRKMDVKAASKWTTPNDSIHLDQIFAEMLGRRLSSGILQLHRCRSPSPPNNTDHNQAFVIYVRHASFQSYHCRFPQKYLRELYHNGTPTSEGVIPNRTRPYDFCDVLDRGGLV